MCGPWAAMHPPTGEDKNAANMIPSARSRCISLIDDLTVRVRRVAQARHARSCSPCYAPPLTASSRPGSIRIGGEDAQVSMSEGHDPRVPPRFDPSSPGFESVESNPQVSNALPHPRDYTPQCVRLTSRAIQSSIRISRSPPSATLRRKRKDRLPGCHDSCPSCDLGIPAVGRVWL